MTMAERSPEPTSPLQAALRGAVGLLLLLAGLVVYVQLNVMAANASRHQNDFKHLWAGTVLVRQGISPYDADALFEVAKLSGLGAINPYVYLPFTAQAMLPLGFLSFEAAAQTWFVVNHLLLWAGLVLLLTARPPDDAAPPRSWRLAWVGAAVAAAGASFAFYRTLTAGQLNMVLFAGFAAVFHLLSRRREGAAGTVAAFIALFKIAPGILLLHFILMRRWRALVAMIVAGGALALVSMLHVGPRTYLDFIPVARQMSYGSSTWSHAATFYRDPFNQSINSFAHHAFSGLSGETQPWYDIGPAKANLLTAAASLLLLALTVAAGWMAHTPERWRDTADTPADTPSQPRAMPRHERAFFGAVVMIGLLLPSLMWDHYMTIAMVAWCVLLTTPGARRPWLRLAILLALAAALGYPMAHGHPAWREGHGLLLMSFRLWPCLVLWAWCCTEAVLGQDTSEAP